MRRDRAMEALGWLHGATVHSRRVRVLADWFARMIPAGHRVLDVGCGDGLIDRIVLEHRPDIEIRGVDVGARAHAHIDVALFDGKTLPFADDAFDTVLACDVVHHTPDPLLFVGEIARVARRAVIIKDHVIEGVAAVPTLRLMDYVGNAPHGVALPYNYMTAGEWQRVRAACGLTETECHRRLGLYPWWCDWLFGRNLHFVARYRVAGAWRAGDDQPAAPRG